MNNNVNDSLNTKAGEIERKIQEDFKERANNIPEKMMRSFSKRASEAARGIVEVKDPSYVKIAYAIFTGYCLGFVTGNIKKIADDIDEKNKIDENEIDKIDINE